MAYHIYTEMTTDKTRVCKCCGRELPIDAFETNRCYRGMKGTTCHDCVNKKKAKAAERNREYRARIEADSIRKTIAHKNRLSGVKELFEAKQEGFGNLSAWTTKELLDELKRRGMLYDHVAEDYREIYLR